MSQAHMAAERRAALIREVLFGVGTGVTPATQAHMEAVRSHCQELVRLLMSASAELETAKAEIKRLNAIIGEPIEVGGFTPADLQLFVWLNAKERI